MQKYEQKELDQASYACANINDLLTTLIKLAENIKKDRPHTAEHIETLTIGLFHNNEKVKEYLINKNLEMNLKKWELLDLLNREKMTLEREVIKIQNSCQHQFEKLPVVAYIREEHICKKCGKLDFY